LGLLIAVRYGSIACSGLLAIAIATSELKRTCPQSSWGRGLNITDE